MPHHEAGDTLRVPSRARSAGAWSQALFAAALLVPCLFATRPTLLAPPASKHEAANVVAATNAASVPCSPTTLGRARLVIHVEACRFELFDACGRVQRSGPCSTGNDSTLQAPDGRQWMFRTPRGVRRVHYKAENPVWYKPDWAFIEEGRAVPADTAESRYAHGMLGRYALDIGNGYLVHGSPYRIGIGTRSTHGCVRLLEADLEVVYRTLRVGDDVVLR